MNAFYALGPHNLGVLSTGLFGLIQLLSFSLYPALSEASHLSHGWIVFSFTFGSLLFVWSSSFWTLKSDLLGRSRILALGLFGLGLSQALLFAIATCQLEESTNFLMLMTSRLVYGIFCGAIVSVVQAWWRDQDGDPRDQMLKHSLGLNVGRLSAPVLVLSFSGNLNLILGSLCVASLVLGVVCLKTPRSLAKIISPVPESQEQFTMVLVIAFLSTTFIGLIHSFLALDLQKKLFLDVAETSKVSSVIFCCVGVCVLVFQAFIKHKPFFSSLRLLVIGSLSWLSFVIVFSSTDLTSSGWFLILSLSLGIAAMSPGYLSLLKAGGLQAGRTNSIQTLGLCCGGLLSLFESTHLLLSVCLLLCVSVAYLAQNKESVYA